MEGEGEKERKREGEKERKRERTNERKNERKVAWSARVGKVGWGRVGYVCLGRFY